MSRSCTFLPTGKRSTIFYELFVVASSFNKMRQIRRLCNGNGGNNISNKQILFNKFQNSHSNYKYVRTLNTKPYFHRLADQKLFKSISTWLISVYLYLPNVDSTRWWTKDLLFILCNTNSDSILDISAICARQKTCRRDYSIQKNKLRIVGAIYFDALFNTEWNFEHLTS